MAARNISGKEWKELLGGSKPVVVDYWAPWCGYCRRIGPAYDLIAEQFDAEVEIVKINIDEEEDLAKAETIEVIPTLVLYRGGKSNYSKAFFLARFLSRLARLMAERMARRGATLMLWDMPTPQ